MSEPILTVFLDGIAFWSPAWPGWAQAAPALRELAFPELPAGSGDHHDLAATDMPSRRPSPTLLGANERRRAPESVLLALELAQAAVADAGADPAAVASVFTSTHGDLAIVDALCTTLAADPLLLSPTRFHHSVHNVASGYWAIAAGNGHGSSAVAQFGHAFAAGWLEATTLCLADARPTLLVGTDTTAAGALASVNTSRGLLGVALVLAPQPGARTRWRVEFSVAANATRPEPLASTAARSLADNAMADALPLFEALAAGRARSLRLPLGAGCGLRMALRPVGAAPEAAPAGQLAGQSAGQPSTAP